MKKESCHLGSVQFKCIIDNLLSINGMFYILFIHTRQAILHYHSGDQPTKLNSYAFTNCTYCNVALWQCPMLLDNTRFNQWNHTGLRFLCFSKHAIQAIRETILTQKAIRSFGAYFFFSFDCDREFHDVIYEILTTCIVWSELLIPWTQSGAINRFHSNPLA